jgi:hypothetical protein
MGKKDEKNDVLIMEKLDRCLEKLTYISVPETIRLRLREQLITLSDAKREFDSEWENVMESLKSITEDPALWNF